MLQEVFIQWRAIPLEDIETPIGLLKTLTIRRATDLLRKIYREREGYIGPWLPGPLETNDGSSLTHSNNPESHQEMAQSLSVGFMLLLEQLTPTERAVFLLRAGFDYSFKEVADVLSLNTDQCRQLFARAKKRLNLKNRDLNIDVKAHQKLLTSFQRAIETENIDNFAQHLTADIILYSDGGGNAISALRPILGRAKVYRLLRGLAKKWQQRDILFKPSNINGAPALLWKNGQSLQTVVSIELQGEQIYRIYLMRNPDKIRHLQ